jgi:hypothetical protein
LTRCRVKGSSLKEIKGSSLKLVGFSI